MIPDHHKRRLLKYSVIAAISFVFFFTAYSLSTTEMNNSIENFLLNSLGKTDTWSGTYGPGWFVQIMNDFSALGGFTITSSLVIIISCYFLLKKKYEKLFRLLVISISGGLFLLLLKYIYSGAFFNVINLLFQEKEMSFPSGHAMMSLIVYLTILNLIFEHSHHIRTEKFCTISVLIISFVIGLSRIFVGAHNIFEIIAGWAAGGFWIGLTSIVHTLTNNLRSQFKIEKIKENHPV